MACFQGIVSWLYSGRGCPVRVTAVSQPAAGAAPIPAGANLPPGGKEQVPATNLSVLGQDNCHSLPGEPRGQDVLDVHKTTVWVCFLSAPRSFGSFLVTMADHLVSLISTASTTSPGMF